MYGIMIIHCTFISEQSEQVKEYRASAKGALANGAISSTGTNSPSQVFFKALAPTLLVEK